jgi:hypothetical protein
MIVLLAI